MKVTLEQWRMLQAVVEAGGFNQAAEMVHKSPSSVHAAVHKLEQQLGVDLLAVQGRKVLLTEAGRALLRRAHLLLEEARDLEDMAEHLATGVEAEVRLAVDQVFPANRLTEGLAEFSSHWPKTRIELRETVLSGGVELLYAGEVDLLISGLPVQGFIGRPLMLAEFICVAHPEHPLHHMGELSFRDLKRFRQLVIRDSSSAHRLDAGWLEAEQRWTVSHVATSLRMLKLGLGFAWLPRHLVAEAIASKELQPLNLPAQGLRQVPLQLIYADPEGAGPATRALAESLLKVTARG
ncbi:DNA-binding transcriptional regulator, LysR family [Marinospirillum celere]|uniref:DNA-binding transcriptional regulator, LysR family n=1 Tax=Marinospirillum celere TaxID=1122252 RepID=A0A1I1GPC9_9GAMM|nr:LysR family transcriptional regulator [Marinospirillum celere]SFC13607.1 DNA-binding transcriptional regulator, LysR family [Marinospirillum celere]